MKKMDLPKEDFEHMLLYILKVLGNQEMKLFVPESSREMEKIGYMIIAPKKAAQWLDKEIDDTLIKVNPLEKPEFIGLIDELENGE